jgi:hypothetical protein
MVSIRFWASLQHRQTLRSSMEIFIEVPSAATREALGKLGQWLDSES